MSDYCYVGLGESICNSHGNHTSGNGAGIVQRAFDRQNSDTEKYTGSSELLEPNSFIAEYLILPSLYVNS